jgi:hypothetical protein
VAEISSHHAKAAALRKLVYRRDADGDEADEQAFLVTRESPTSQEPTRPAGRNGNCSPSFYLLVAR